MNLNNDVFDCREDIDWFDDLVQLPMVTESQFQGFLAMPNVHVGQGEERQGQ